MKTIKWMFVLLIGCLSLLPLSVAADSGWFDTTPTQQSVKKQRVAYYQGGDYGDYYDYLHATTEALMALGWISPQEIPVFAGKNSKALWHWLATHTRSDYLQFVSDAYFSADWDQAQRSRSQQAMLQRVNDAQDIDLIFAMGTWAGNDLANNLHHTPTFIMSVSDPLSSGVIRSRDDSGFEHVYASFDPQLYAQQIQLFHKLIGFKRLGVPFENSLAGRSYAAIDLLEATAREKGFELVPCYTQSDITDQQRANASVIQCFETLAQQVDALYVTVQGGVNTATIPQLVAIANQYGIPTFSQNGEQEVRYGYLLSLSRRTGITAEGRFLAENMGRVLNGATPRRLTQVFENASSITLNMKTAQDIGLYLSADVLAAADKLYWQIELPER